MQRHFVRPRQNASCTTTDLSQELQCALVRAKYSNKPADKADFIALLAQQPELIRAAQFAMLRHLRQQGVAANMLQCAQAEALACVLGAAHARTTDLVQWQPSKSAFGTWWGLQAFYHYNNTQRRHDERTCGLWRSTGDVLNLDCDWQQDEQGQWQPLPLPDSTADPAAKQLLTQGFTWADLAPYVENQDTLQIKRLQSWMALNALRDSPISWQTTQASLNWRHGAQAALAKAQGVTTRTLRNHAQAIEATLTRIAARIAITQAD